MNGFGEAHYVYCPWKYRDRDYYSNEFAKDFKNDVHLKVKNSK